jgi:hypothetical protein
MKAPGNYENLCVMRETTNVILIHQRFESLAWIHRS